jgi:hypothetical protein
MRSRVAFVLAFMLGSITQISAATIRDTINGDSYQPFSGGDTVSNTAAFFVAVALPFSSPISTTITNITAYIANTGSVDIGIMVDSSGVPSGIFLHDQVVSLSIPSPVSLTSLSWNITGGNTYWLAAIASSGTSAAWQLHANTSDIVAAETVAGGAWTSLPGNELPEALISSDVTTTPLPAALPLFATGLGALGLLGWTRKRKQTATLPA